MGNNNPLTFVSRRIHLVMNTIHETELFSDWLEKLCDLKSQDADFSAGQQGQGRELWRIQGVG